MGAVAEHSLIDVRADFPVLAREFNGRRVAYLDSAATSQRPRQVVGVVGHTVPAGIGNAVHHGYPHGLRFPGPAAGKRVGPVGTG